MTDLSAESKVHGTSEKVHIAQRFEADAKALAAFRPKHKLRFVTAASLFDGHDAAINIMRRILQGMGAEVIHLGHNRSVDEVVTAALQEDVQAIAVSSYQGGHVEYFRYMIDLLKARGGERIQVFGGGGGVIVADEIRALAEVRRAHLQPRGRPAHGPAGHDRRDADACGRRLVGRLRRPRLDALAGHGDAAWRALAQLISALENGRADAKLVEALHARAAAAKVPVLGITGTGGAGKSSLCDELIRRLRLDQGDALRIAVISIDPSRRKSGGALLGDRIRMNAIGPWNRQPGGSTAVYHAQPGHARLRLRDQPGTARRAGRVQGRRLRPDRGRDFGHRPGRRRHRAAGRHPDVRDDARVRRCQPAREDRHARLRRVRGHQQVRPQGRGRRAARCRQAGAAQPRGVQAGARADAGVRHHGQPLQRRRRHRAVPGPEAAPGRGGPDVVAGAAAAGHNAPQHAPGADRAGRARALPGRDRRHRARLQAPGARAGGAGARDPAAARRGPHAHRRQARQAARRRGGHQPGRAARVATRSDGEEAAGDVARHAAGLRRRRIRGEDPRQGNPHRADPHHAGGQQDPQGGLAGLRVPWRAAEVAAARQRARQLPIHRRHLRLQARRRRPGAHVCRRGRCVSHQPALQDGQPGPAGQAPVDRVRFGHPVRPRPRSAARHLRQGRQLGRLDRHPGRHAGAVFGVRPDAPGDLGQHDDQRPGADDPGDVHEHRDRAEPGQVQGPAPKETAASRPTPKPPRSANGCWPMCAARCRPTS